MAPVDPVERSLSIPTAETKQHPYERLKAEILAGDLAPGTQLVESALAAWFDVSRTPVREALTRLEQDGLLTRDKSGVFVRKRSPGEVLDIYETRTLLESASARFAAERRTSHDLLLMRRAHRQWDGIEQTDHRAMMAANREFHRSVWRASHNESLMDLLVRIDQQVARFPATTLSAPGRWDQAGQQHLALVSAIELRDADKAAALAMEHFTDARNIRLRLWDES